MNPFELTKRIGVKTPIGQQVIDRAVTGDVVQVISGLGPNAGVFMGPGQPLQPMAQDTAYGRQFDYQWGTNLGFSPRAQEPISFNQLRQLADSYDLVRLLIETRKDQLVKFEWAIMPRDESRKPDDRCVEFTNFLQFPDGRHNWQTWLRGIIEEMLVTDAACVQPVLTRGGDLYSLDWFDGSTLHLLIDDTGRTPRPPDVAYQQVIKGVPAVDYSSDELIYSPRNNRVNRLYGYSPVEQIIMTVNIALRRQLNQLQFFTEGNIPEALITVPKEWTPAQIKQYQEMWDIMHTGDTAQRRHVKFIPFGTKYYPTKEDPLKDVFDEWLARVCCYAFSLPPAPFVRDQNRATAESAKEAALEEGLHPLLGWVRDLMNLILWKYKGWYDLQFDWADSEPSSPIELMTMNTGYVRAGVISVDEARQDLGKDAIGMPNAVFTAGGVLLVKDILNPPAPPVLDANGIPIASTGQPGQQKPPGQPLPQGQQVVAGKAPPFGTKPKDQSGVDRSKQTEGEPAKPDELPANKLFDLHVHLPNQDVLVETGPTTINMPAAAHAPLPAPLPAPVNKAWPTNRTITAKRNVEGNLEAVMTEEAVMPKHTKHVFVRKDGELE